ncbi:hypothetical protein [Pandoravirus japonicus]|uniref:Transmembrane protein n=1 Tax=Pandoravirus japonicus TaxID=2823154 RepID=A0A811BNH4_9VIRU|nr:hypothetical protein [Pandoravirus japonicus]
MTLDAARRRATGPLAGVLGLFFSLPSLLCRRPSAVSMTLSPSGGKKVSRAARGQEMQPGHLARAPIASQKTLGDLALTALLFLLFSLGFSCRALSLWAHCACAPREATAAGRPVPRLLFFSAEPCPPTAHQKPTFSFVAFFIFILFMQTNKKKEKSPCWVRAGLSLSLKRARCP